MTLILTQNSGMFLTNWWKSLPGTWQQWIGCEFRAPGHGVIASTPPAIQYNKAQKLPKISAKRKLSPYTVIKQSSIKLRSWTLFSPLIGILVAQLYSSTPRCNHIVMGSNRTVIHICSRLLYLTNVHIYIYESTIGSN